MSNLTEHMMEMATATTVARPGVEAFATYQGGIGFDATATSVSCAPASWSINRKKTQNVALHPHPRPPDSTA